MAADVAAVDAAILAALAADAELMTLVPDGVYLDNPPPNATRFVVVQHQTHDDVEAFRAPAYEEFLYGVTTRILDTSDVDANAAAYRIHTVLQDTVLTIAGYTHSSTLRVQRIKTRQLDPIDNDLRWQIAGGDYEVFVSPD